MTYYYVYCFLIRISSMLQGKWLYLNSDIKNMLCVF